MTSTAPTSRSVITATASATVADAGTEMSSSLPLSRTTTSSGRLHRVFLRLAPDASDQPKSSSMMFSRSTPSESSMSITALFITPGPHM